MSEPQWLDNFSQSSTAGMADSTFTDNLMEWILHSGELYIVAQCSTFTDILVHCAGALFKMFLAAFILSALCSSCIGLNSSLILCREKVLWQRSYRHCKHSYCELSRKNLEPPVFHFSHTPRGCNSEKYYEV